MNNQGVPVNPIRGNLGDRAELQPPRVGDENNQCMPSTRSQGEPLTPYDPVLNRTLRRMNNQGVPVNPIRGHLGDRAELQPPRVGDENNQAASSNEATSSGEVQVPQNNDHAPVAEEHNRWSMEGQRQIYRDAKMLNEKEKMARLITDERKVLTGSLHTIPDIHRLFQHHKCEWMGKELGTYSEKIVREFYASYTATLRGSIQRNANPRARTPLKDTLVRGFSVDISENTIHRFLYGPSPSHTWALNTAEFDYRWDIVWGGEFQQSARKSETVLH
uniref:Integrase core domain containing protein n=1 Tax=Solanum tuberosum TaxID=4113 RepID=M1DZA4_SOLTU